MNIVLQAPISLKNTKLQTEYGNYSIDSTGKVTVDSRAVPALIGAGFLPVDAQQKISSHVVTSGEATANTVTIATGLNSIIGKLVQVLRSNVDVTGDAVITSSNGDLTVADGSTFNLTAGDVINYAVGGY